MNKKPIIVFDKHGDWILPAKIKWPGEMKPKMTLRQWTAWLYLTADRSQLPKRYIKRTELFFLGSKMTKWRTIKKLRDMGYIE